MPHPCHTGTVFCDTGRHRTTSGDSTKRYAEQDFYPSQQVTAAAAGTLPARLRRALVGPCTTTIRGLASEVLLEPGVDPVPLLSAVNLDSVESVSIAVLVQRVGRLSDERMEAVCEALAVAVDCRR